MADKYTDEEIEAINAYRGDIQQIKRGTSTVPVEGKSWKEGENSFHRRNARFRKFELSKERDAAVKKGVSDGASISEIARTTGLSREAVKSRMKRLKLKGRDE